MIERVENKERIEKKPLVIGMVGCLASGKTTLSKELGSRWGMEPIEEKFPENPFLAKFYENPTEFSFRSQMFFLTSKVEQLKGVEKNKVALFDPGLTMDFLYAKTHHMMGWMNDGEWNLYQDVFYALSRSGSLLYPDMHIVVIANQEDLRKRIVDRGRKYERWILENYPEYLEKLVKSVDDWSRNENKHSFVFVADTSLENGSCGVEFLANRIESHIRLKFGFDSNYTLPNIHPSKITHIDDIFPGSNSARFRR